MGETIYKFMGGEEVGLVGLWTSINLWEETLINLWEGLTGRFQTKGQF